MTQDLRALEEKMDTLIKLVACGLIANKSQREQIEMLSRIGFPPKEIAGLIGTTSNTVSVNLTAIRKAKKKSGRK
jgi:DNA-binding CsgD family transcriptional regulator